MPIHLPKVIRPCVAAVGGVLAWMFISMLLNLFSESLSPNSPLHLNSLTITLLAFLMAPAAAYVVDYGPRDRMLYLLWVGYAYLVFLVIITLGLAVACMRIAHLSPATSLAGSVIVVFVGTVLGFFWSRPDTQVRQNA
jgi:hypothetical protein